MNRRSFYVGLALVAASALLWSLGGTFARFIDVDSTWTKVFWRSYFATVFLVCFMIWQEGLEGTLSDFRRMGWPGLTVAGCFAIASTSFVVALGYTTVANILLVQAGAPLLAALIAFLVFKEKVNTLTWVAIVAVCAGVAYMVSDSVTGLGSPIGDGLSVLIVLVFSVAIVVTRHYRGVRMTPAVTLAVFLSFLFSVAMGGAGPVSGADLGWLFAFGALNLGLGLACFALGARHIPAALAALVGTIEPVLGPVWVWLVHGEVPSQNTLIGGAVVCVALIAHILVEMWRTTTNKVTVDS